MGFMTPALLAGIGLIAVPILLHLIMRRQPRLLEFPALQFVKRRQQANRRRLNLRHWLLLALRCLLVAGIACALARPVLRGTGLRGKEGAPLAVAVVMDNSLRMEYVRHNQTRLALASELAQSLVKKLPDDSKIAVVDLSHNTSDFAVDGGTAEARLKNIVAESNPRPLAEATRNAIQLVTEQEDRRQEVFLFCDLNAAEFSEAALTTMQESLAEAPDVRIYVVDLGTEEGRNVSLEPLDLNTTSLRQGEPLRIDVAINSVGYEEQPLVEIFLGDSAKTLVKRGQRLVDLSAEGTGQTQFVLNDLPLGTHQGVVQLASSDPLDFDNRRYFTVSVHPAGSVLLLGEFPSDTVFMSEALTTGEFHCTSKTFSDAARIKLSDFDAVCLMDPPPLSEALWSNLVDYAQQGGGVGIFLGHRATLSGFNSGAPQELLPGKLKLRSREETWLRLQRLDHPALAGFKDYAEDIPWRIYPVWRHWVLEELAGNAYAVARYANNQPALLERSVGNGRVLTLTTPFSDPLQPPGGREPWNFLLTHPEPFPFWFLANQLVAYLSQNSDQQLNYLAGETAVLRLSPRQRVTDFVLKEPTGNALRRTLPPGDDAIRIGTTRQLGNYRVAAGGKSDKLDEGFSVNAAAELSQLQRADPQAIAEVLPAKRFQIASTLDDVEQYVNIGRRGRELFSWAITLVALVWGSEHLLANRFYREERDE